MYIVLRQQLNVPHIIVYYGRILFVFRVETYCSAHMRIRKQQQTKKVNNNTRNNEIARAFQCNDHDLLYVCYDDALVEY